MMMPEFPVATPLAPANWIAEVLLPLLLLKISAFPAAYPHGMLSALAPETVTVIAMKAASATARFLFIVTSPR
jgi:hypothetical protein